MAKIGQPIFLQCWLEDGRSNKFVKAVCRNVSGTEVSGSPAYLSYVGEGLYTNYSSVIFPLNQEFITATYLVYDDSGFTSPSFDYFIGDDVFSAEFADLFNKVDILVSAIHTDLTGEVSDMTCVVGSIEPSVVIAGSIEDVVLAGMVEDSVLLIGVIEDCIN